MALTEFPPCLLYVGTEDGLRGVHLEADGCDVHSSALTGQAVRAIDVNPADPTDVFVGCGLRGWGLYRSNDAGKTVESLGFDEQWVWGIIRHPTDLETVYVGTEPPMVYVSTDSGATFEPFQQIDDLPSRSRWTFFHEPFESGHVHGFAIHPDRPEQLFAGVEHGALIYTYDAGDSWNETLVGEDLHRVVVDPTDPDRIVAAAGSGLYVSDDAGRSWKQVDALRGKYLHAIAIDPTDPDHWYVYADIEGSPLYRSTDGGETWDAIGDGLPAASPADTLRLHPDDPATLVYVGDGGDRSSRIFVSTNRGEEWTEFDTSLPKAWRLEVAPGLDAPS